MVFGYPIDWDDDWSGYTPPNSDLARHGDTMDGLPAPLYETRASSGSYVPPVDWASALVELALDRFGGENRWHPHGYPTQKCGCGVTWVGDIPCWFCDPQPAPSLILLHPLGSGRG